MEKQTITAEQLRKKLDQSSNIFILDVRDEEKYQAGSLVYKGIVARNIPYVRMTADTQDTASDFAQIPAGAEIVTICTTGNKARKAAAFLCEKGYSAVSLQGGLTAWRVEE